MVSRSKLGEVLRSEGPRHTPILQGLNYLGLQQSDFQPNGGSRSIVQLRVESFEACSHETDPSVDFERDVSVFKFYNSFRAIARRKPSSTAVSTVTSIESLNVHAVSRSR